MFLTYKDIKTFEDACMHQGLNPDEVMAELNNLKALPADLLKPHIADAQLLIIAKSINQLDDNYQPNWNDWDECKYYPWYRIDASEEKPAGFGFSYSLCVCDHSGSNVGSRLCFRSSEVALYVAEQFKEIYINKFLIQG